MWIVCWQTILMKYGSFFFSKIRKMLQNLLSAAVVIGAFKGLHFLHLKTQSSIIKIIFSYIIISILKLSLLAALKIIIIKKVTRRLKTEQNTPKIFIIHHKNPPKIIQKSKIKLQSIYLLNSLWNSNIQTDESSTLNN